LRFRIRVGFGNLRPGLAPPETQLAENALTLPYSQGNVMLRPQVVCQQFAIPQVLPAAQVAGRLAQHPLQVSPLVGLESCGAPVALAFLQARKSIGVESVDPALHGHRILAQERRHFTATQAVTDQQHPMEPVVISGFFRAENFLLDSDLHDVRVTDLEFAHGGTLPYSTKIVNGNMLQYLCRYV
jgi:hypothetical protein